MFKGHGRKDLLDKVVCF